MELVTVILGKIAASEPGFVPVTLILKVIKFLSNAIHRIGRQIAAFKEGVNGRWADSLIAIAPQAGGKGVVNAAVLRQAAFVALLILSVIRLETVFAAGPGMVGESARWCSFLTINHADTVPVATLALFMAQGCTAGQMAQDRQDDGTARNSSRPPTL